MEEGRKKEEEQKRKQTRRSIRTRSTLFSQLVSADYGIMLAVFRVFLRGAAIMSARNKERAYLLSRLSCTPRRRVAR